MRVEEATELGTLEKKKASKGYGKPNVKGEIREIFRGYFVELREKKINAGGSLVGFRGFTLLV